MEYLRRIIDSELDELFDEIPALAIDGLKGIGKTTTAQQRAARVFALDAKAVRETVEADPSRICSGERPVLVDEWQKLPEVWDVVRRAVDANPKGGQFLLVGSATPAPHATAHTGAGRIGRLRMRPLTLSERGLTRPTVSLRDLLAGGRPLLTGDCELALSDYVAAIVSSGFPAVRLMSDRARNFQLDSYLRNVVDRDVPEQGLAVRRADAMLAWLRAYAAATATTASYSQILNAATPGLGEKPARSTSVAYRDVLTGLWLLDPVPAWQPTGSFLTRLGQSPKHHLADPALAARLLGLTRDSLLDGEGESLDPRAGGILGALFESLVTLCVRVPAQAAEASIGHLRTRNGDHEVDLMVMRPDGRVLAIEVKLAGSVRDGDVKHLRWLEQQLGSRLLDSLVVTTGRSAYRRKDGVGVVPLGLLAP